MINFCFLDEELFSQTLGGPQSFVRFEVEDIKNIFWKNSTHTTDIWNKTIKCAICFVLNNNKKCLVIALGVGLGALTQVGGIKENRGNVVND